MQTGIFTNIKPGTSPIKRNVVRVGFLALGRVLESISHIDEEVRQELTDWPDGYKFSMNVLPHGPALAMQKKGEFLKIIGTTPLAEADLVVEIKNLDTAFKMITAQLGAHQVYAQHKIGVVGQVADSMKLIRMIYLAEDYLFPEFMSRRILKKVKEPSLDKLLNRLHILTIGFLFGR